LAADKVLESEATGPLQGVKILDLTSVVFGAYATQMLGDLGADVIKVESPVSGRGEGGDIMRWAGKTPEGAPEDLGPIFMTINRNKRSVLLDLAGESGKAALRMLIEWADVFACSVRYDGMKRLGLGYDEVKAIRPDIVYVHGSGYGAAGPYAGEPAYDDLIQSASGLADRREPDAASDPVAGGRQGLGPLHDPGDPGRPLSPPAHRRGAVRRSAHVRMPDQLQSGGAPVRPRLRSTHRPVGL
jgi:crotonobetainyl-CoA:carnitine CoA-transferase CaiB-like acyl-CoA transferase